MNSCIYCPRLLYLILPRSSVSCNVDNLLLWALAFSCLMYSRFFDCTSIMTVLREARVTHAAVTFTEFCRSTNVSLIFSVEQTFVLNLGRVRHLFESCMVTALNGYLSFQYTSICLKKKKKQVRKIADITRLAFHYIALRITSW